MVGLVRFGLTREAGYLRLTGGHLLRGARETMLHHVGVLGSGIVASHGILSWADTCWHSRGHLWGVFGGVHFWHHGSVRPGLSHLPGVHPFTVRGPHTEILHFAGVGDLPGPGHAGGCLWPCPSGYRESSHLLRGISLWVSIPGGRRGLGGLALPHAGLGLLVEDVPDLLAGLSCGCLIL